MRLKHSSVCLIALLFLHAINYAQKKNLPVNLEKVSGVLMNANATSIEPSGRNSRAKSLRNRDVSSLSWFTLRPKYSIALGVNVLDNGEGNLPINATYSFKNPFFLTAERRFKSKLSMALTLSTNRLAIASVEKGYVSIDAGGQFYFNDYLFNSNKIEMYAGLGLGRYFLENNGNNTLNVTGGGRYWFSKNCGVSFQGLGKVGLAPINKSVLNHYQYNFGLVWRFNRDKVKMVDDVFKLEEIKKTDSIHEQDLSEKITEKADDTTKVQNITIAKETDKTDLPVVSQKKEYECKIGDNLTKCFGINNITFDFDKYLINDQASKVLEKILVVLNQYPTMKIAIRSHTDCRQMEKYNLGLSENRAIATMNWLITKGIDKSRLSAKGYGKSQPLNNCNCSPTIKSNCSDLQYQENRRSEFIITAL